MVIQLVQEKLGQFGFRSLALSSTTTGAEIPSHSWGHLDSTPAKPSPPPPPCWGWWLLWEGNQEDRSRCTTARSLEQLSAGFRLTVQLLLHSWAAGAWARRAVLAAQFEGGAPPHHYTVKRAQVSFSPAGKTLLFLSLLFLLFNISVLSVSFLFSPPWQSTSPPWLSPPPLPPPAVVILRSLARSSRLSSRLINPLLLIPVINQTPFLYATYLFIKWRVRCEVSQKWNSCKHTEIRKSRKKRIIWRQLRHKLLAKRLSLTRFE